MTAARPHRGGGRGHRGPPPEPVPGRPSITAPVQAEKRHPLPCPVQPPSVKVNALIMAVSTGTRWLEWRRPDGAESEQDAGWWSSLSAVTWSRRGDRAWDRAYG